MDLADPERAQLDALCRQRPLVGARSGNGHRFHRGDGELDECDNRLH